MTARLTDAQRRALEWLKEDWQYNRKRMIRALTFLCMSGLAERDYLSTAKRTEHWRYRLTPAGKAALHD